MKVCVEMRAVLIFGGFSKLSVSELTEIPQYSNTCVMKIALPTIVDKSVDRVKTLYVPFEYHGQTLLRPQISSKKIILRK